MVLSKAGPYPTARPPACRVCRRAVGFGATEHQDVMTGSTRTTGENPVTLTRLFRRAVLAGAFLAMAVSAQARRDDVEGGAGDIGGDLLFEPGHRDAGLAHHLATVGEQGPLEQLHHGALPGAIAAQQTDPLASLDRQSGVIEQRWAAEGHADVLQAQEGHRYSFR